MEPIQVIVSESGGPYDYRTRMGWCIVEPVTKGDSKGPTSSIYITSSIESFCNKGLHQRHNSKMFKMMYRNHFIESALTSSKIMMRKGEVSVEDRKFLLILEKRTVKNDHHYVVPLPF